MEVGEDCFEEILDILIICLVNIGGGEFLLGGISPLSPSPVRHTVLAPHATVLLSALPRRFLRESILWTN